jgi:hypothetical protein
MGKAIGRLQFKEENTVMAKQARGTTADHGDKTIELTVRFWTDNIAPTKGKIIPKNGWAAGVVYIHKSPAHGFEPQDPIPFNTLMELPGKIEKVLANHGVQLRPYSTMKKYIVP